MDMNNNINKKFKRPQRKTIATTNPQASKPRTNCENENTIHPRCPLLAKDSEWLDMLQASTADSSKATENISDEEEVLQLVECEDGPEMKPLTMMFPGLLQKDRQTLEDMLNKTMSTTEVTKQLLGQKADFSLMKKVNRLIPSDKKWLETVSEDSNSILSETQLSSMASGVAHSILGFTSSVENKVTDSNIDLRTSETDVNASSSKNYLIPNNKIKYHKP